MATDGATFIGGIRAGLTRLHNAFAQFTERIGYIEQTANNNHYSMQTLDNRFFIHESVHDPIAKSDVLETELGNLRSSMTHDYAILKQQLNGRIPDAESRI